MSTRGLIVRIICIIMFVVAVPAAIGFAVGWMQNSSIFETETMEERGGQP